MSRLTDFFKTGGQYEHSPMMHVQDQKADGVNGGTSVTGRNNRTLNTVLGSNEIIGASLSSNLVTLPAGEYYIQGSAVGYSSPYVRTIVETSTGTELLRGANDTGNITSFVGGRITLASSTDIQLVSFIEAGLATKGLGRAFGTGASTGVEVYADLKIWQLDAIKTSPIIHDNKLYPLPGNTYVTGDMYGLEYSYTSANSITVDAGICYDSLNTTLLTGSASQAVAIGTTINQIYNLFLCDDGLVKTDTNVEGTTLLAGSVTALRWIGFVRTNSAGEVCDFAMNGDTYAFAQASKCTFVSGFTSTTYVPIDLSPIVPVSRVDEVYIGCSASNVYNSCISISKDAVNVVTFTMGYTVITDIFVTYGYSGAAFALRQIPISSALFMKTDSGTNSMAVPQVTLKR